MRKFLIPAVIALLSIANFANPVDAQSDAMSAQKRDALIGQLENVLQQLQNDRAATNSTSTSASQVVEGSLSADNLMASAGSYSNMGSYGGSGSRNYETGSYNGYGASVPAAGQSYSYGSLPVGGYATGQAYAAPMVQAAPVIQKAPMAYAAPMVQAAPVQQAPVITSMGPLPDLTLPPINITEPAPAPAIIVQQAPPMPSFQPVFMNFVSPLPMPMPQPRRHKCCLFGR